MLLLNGLAYLTISAACVYLAFLAPPDSLVRRVPLARLKSGLAVSAAVAAAAGIGSIADQVKPIIEVLVDVALAATLIFACLFHRGAR